MEKKLARLEGFLQGGSAGQIPAVDVLPAPGRAARIRYLKTDGKVYVDNGVAWYALT
jgi:hypothetical protein